MRRLSLECFEQRHMLSAVVSVGDWIVTDDVTEFRLPITVSGDDLLEGINLRVQVDDGSTEASAVPVITDLDLAGTSQSPTLWTGHSNGDLGEDITPRVATVWTDTLDGQTVAADGVLGFVVLDLSASSTGTWNVSIADTLAGSTELVTATSTLINGSITIVDSMLYQSPVVDIAVVPVMTPTDLSGSPNGESSTLPPAADDLNEWGPYWLEIWAQSQDPADGVSHIAVDILYDDTMFQPSGGAAEPGPAFETPGFIAAAMTASGTIHVQAATDQADVGDDAYVLIGRISMIGQSAVPGVPADTASTTVSTSTGDSLVQLESGAGGIAVGVGQTTADYGSVGYDLNDNGQVDIADLALFASYFGKDVAGESNPLVGAADYNNDGEIGIADLAWFAANFGKVPGDNLSFPDLAAPIIPATIPFEEPDTILPPAEEISEFVDKAALLPVALEDEQSVALLGANQTLQEPAVEPIITPVTADAYFAQPQDDLTELPVDPQASETANEADSLLLNSLEDELIESLL